jgi:hypothetical protein
MAPSQIITGGCQCGLVRYRITGPLFDGHICHCRMCQKATGNLFAALIGVAKADVVWETQEPSYFKSSAAATRGFCPHCGTPLTFAYDATRHMNVAIGSLDRPALATIQNQFGAESTHPAFATLHRLPASRTEDDVSPADLLKLRSRQHPDHP